MILFVSRVFGHQRYKVYTPASVDFFAHLAAEETWCKHYIDILYCHFTPADSEQHLH